MKKILLILVLAIILLSIFVFYNNNNPKIVISSLLKKGDIRGGDLVYRVNLFGIIPVAKAILKAEQIDEYNGQRVYHLSASANLLEWMAKFFKGYALLDSYIDTETCNPVLFKQKMIIPGKEAIDKKAVYDQKKAIMTIAGVRRQILPNTQDALSAIFNIRYIDFDNVKELEFNINTNQKNYILEATPRVNKDILINNRIYKTVFLKGEIRRRDKNPYHQSRIAMVLLRGKENIPILIKVFASGILINAKLVEIK